MESHFSLKIKYIHISKKILAWIIENMNDLNLNYFGLATPSDISVSAVVPLPLKCKFWTVSFMGGVSQRFLVELNSKLNLNIMESHFSPKIKYIQKQKFLLDNRKYA